MGRFRSTAKKLHPLAPQGEQAERENISVEARPKRQKKSHSLVRRLLGEVAKPDKKAFLDGQVKALYRTVPLFLFCHVAVSTILAGLIYLRQPQELVFNWLGFAWFLAICVLSLCLLYGRQRKPRKILPYTAKIITLLAVGFGLCWGALPFLFLTQADENLQIFILLMMFGASAVGAVALSRLPSAAITYVALVTLSLAFSMLSVAGELGLMLCLFILGYGFVLTWLVIKLHREQLRQALAREEAQRQKQLSTLLLNDFEAGTSDWLWECDLDYRLSYVPVRFLEALGLPLQAVQGYSLAELVRPITQAAAGWDELLEKMGQKEAVVACELDVWVQGRPGRWQLSARPLYDGAGQCSGYRGVGRDITKEWDTGQKLIAAKETAEAASSAKSHFLAVMSHELRTPLNAIVGFAEVLSAPHEVPLDERLAREYASTILQSSRHLQTLINDILDATRIEKNAVVLLEQESDAAELIEIAVRMCRDQAEKADVTLIAELLDNIEIVVDMTRIRQVILNLLTNAIKFSPAGGTVMIVLSRASNNDLKMEIRDSGIGIRPEDHLRIFEPFVQADDGMARRFAGIGLGLSIARKIARLHGGDIVIESVYGDGTTVIFTLPATRVHWPKRRSRPQDIVAA